MPNCRIAQRLAIATVLLDVEAGKIHRLRAESNKPADGYTWQPSETLEASLASSKVVGNFGSIVVYDFKCFSSLRKSCFLTYNTSPLALHCVS
jgi:hypothetical protein